MFVDHTSEKKEDFTIDLRFCVRSSDPRFSDPVTPTSLLKSVKY